MKRVWEVVRKDISDLKNNITKVKKDLKEQQENLHRLDKSARGNPSSLSITGDF